MSEFVKAVRSSLKGGGGGEEGETGLPDSPSYSLRSPSFYGLGKMERFVREERDSWS